MLPDTGTSEQNHPDQEMLPSGVLAGKSIGLGEAIPRNWNRGIRPWKNHAYKQVHPSKR